MADRLAIVDPHIHLWDLWTRLYPHFERPSKGRSGSNAAIARSYLLEEFLDESDGEIEILGAVHVEAFPTDPVKETETLQRVADRSPVPIVFVGNGDLRAPDFPALLDRHAAFAIFRGIRQVVNRHQKPEFSYGAPDLMADPAFLDGLQMLGRRGLSFDLQLCPHQMETAAALAAQAPDTQIILNHDGMWADRDRDGWRVWKNGMSRLAAEPNIAVKISGFGMMDRPGRRKASAPRSTRRWSASASSARCSPRISPSTNSPAPTPRYGAVSTPPAPGCRATSAPPCFATMRKTSTGSRTNPSSPGRAGQTSKRLVEDRS
ncbi:MAG: amidohydrolase family protein [Devosia sp.]|nr:amidohydrolase family protein [Devosia sp.]